MRGRRAKASKGRKGARRDVENRSRALGKERSSQMNSKGGKKGIGVTASESGFWRGGTIPVWMVWMVWMVLLVLLGTARYPCVQSSREIKLQLSTSRIPLDTQFSLVV